MDASNTAADRERYLRARSRVMRALVLAHRDEYEQRMAEEVGRPVKVRQSAAA